MASRRDDETTVMSPGPVLAPVRPIEPGEARRFADTLPDHPLTFGPRCLLKRGVATLWALGDPLSPEAALVQEPWQPREPVAFGTDAAALWELLQRVPGWSSVNVENATASGLRRRIETEGGLAADLLGDVYFLLETEPVAHRHPAVRRLTEEDVALVEAAPPELRPVGFESTLAALAGGSSAGAILDGRLVSAISMSASSERYADIGGHTLEPWRNQGLASAATYLVARDLVRRGLTPVWSTGETNARSQRVARKVGFREFGRRQYVVVPSLRTSTGFVPRR